jgi:hypothetical protein
MGPRPHPDQGEQQERCVSRLRDRVVETTQIRGELALHRLDRPTEIRCARCAGRQVTRWIAVLRDDWTSLWCKSCFKAMPALPNRAELHLMHQSEDDEDN